MELQKTSALLMILDIVGMAPRDCNIFYPKGKQHSPTTLHKKIGKDLWYWSRASKADFATRWGDLEDMVWCKTEAWNEGQWIVMPSRKLRHVLQVDGAYSVQGTTNTVHSFAETKRIENMVCVSV